jgi:hypothetical protein
MIIQYISLGIVVLVFLSQIFLSGNSRLVIIKRIFTGSVFLVSLVLAYYSYAQYSLWRGGELTHLFLSDGPEYFLGYIAYRFWAQYIVSLLVALFFLWWARRYNAKHENKFFYAEEPYLLATSLFLTGHPMWIAYLVATIIFYVLFSLVYRLKYLKNQQGDNGEPRVSFYYGWLPTALLVILMKGALVEIPIIQILVFAKDQFIL